jgi:hypothetical protein
MNELKETHGICRYRVWDAVMNYLLFVPAILEGNPMSGGYKTVEMVAFPSLIGALNQ